MIKLKEDIQTAVDVFKSGNLEKAEELAKKLLKDNPKVAFLYNLLGLISVEQKQIDSAIEYYQKGIKIDSTFAIIYNNLGIIYFKYKSKKNLKKAEEYYKKAISINKEVPEAYTNLGNLYSSNMKVDLAINMHKKAIKIRPNFIFAYLNLANIYVSTGDFKLAEKLLRDSIVISPHFLTAHRLLSRIIKYTSKEKHIEQLQKIFSNEKLKKVDDMKYIAFALGKAFEDIKNYEKSFFYYEKGNDIFRKNINFSLKDEKNKFDTIKKAYNKKLLDKSSKLGFDSNIPIFIIGMPRSGTTLIEQILSSHPHVYGAEEVEFIPDLINFAFRNKDPQLFLNNDIDKDNSFLNELGKKYINSIREKSPKSKKITDKLPINFLAVGFIKLILPKAKIIHCHRNPMDNIFSIFKNHFSGGKIDFAYNLNEITEYYSLYKNLMNHWKNIIPSFIHDIKYENLVSDPEKYTRSLVSFCDLSWSDKCLSFHKNKRLIKTASDTQARKKIYNTSINTWKNYKDYLKKYYKVYKKKL
jgi:tetratricopeptide (TPR) repeat protein